MKPTGFLSSVNQLKRSQIAKPAVETTFGLGKCFVFAGLFVPVLFSTSSCMKRKSPHIPSGANISGFAADEVGTPAAEADVLLEGEMAPVAKTDAKGHFSATISEAYLQNLTSKSPKNRETWSVYIRQLSSHSSGGVSEPIAMNHRGGRDVGVITMRALSTLNGKVVKANGNLITGAGKAQLSIGPDRLVTGTDGTFQLKNAIPGKNSVLAELNTYEKTLDTIDVEPATTINREEPVVLFNTTHPSAVLIPKSSQSEKELDGARTTRSFYVKSTPSAKYIRYNHQIEDMEKVAPLPSSFIQKSSTQKVTALDGTPTATKASTSTDAQSQWRELTPTLDYAFPNSGPATLWFQILDQAGGNRSDLLQATINVNSCASLQAITLNGGASFTPIRRVKVAFSGLPNNATRVRMSESASNLASSPWLAIVPDLDFLLPGPTSSGGGGFNPFGGGGGSSSSNVDHGTHQVFAEVDTTAGSCPVVSATIVLQPFPAFGPMFVINGGATVSPSKIVMINIPQLPPNAVDMRLTDLTPNSPQGVWMRAQPQTILRLADAGSKIVGLEFRDIDGFTSATYTSTIDIIPNQAAGFNLSFLQMVPGPPMPSPPPSRYLVMQLIPPQNATAFRYLELITDGQSGSCAVQDASAIANHPWLNLVPFLPVYACGVGLRTFNVQYQTVDGQLITTTSTIMILPVPETIGSFVINDGAPLTLFPTVKLKILPGMNAVAMSATNLSIQQTTANNSSVYLYGTNFGGSSSSTTNDQWVQTAPSLDFRLDSRGVQTVQIRFRDGNNNVFTPAAVNSVFFDPFPHFPVGVKPLVVNDGAAVTTTALVNLHIIAPESSFAFSVTSDSDVQSVLPLVWRDIPTDVKSSLYGVPWKVFEFDAPFILKGPPGPRTIYVQLKNELGDRSEAYSAVIDYQPPTP